MVAQLRLFTPAPADPLTGPQMSLFDAYEQILLPSQQSRGMARGTISDYWCALRHWSRIMEPTGPLSVGEITEEHLERFADSLQCLDGKCGRTVDKHLGYIEAILSRLAPKGPHNKRGRGILDHFVYADRRDNGAKQIIRRVIPIADISRMYQAADVARYPFSKWFPTADIWRAWLVTIYHSGQSRNDAFLMPSRIPYGQQEISAVVLTEECPLSEVRLQSEHGWLLYNRTKTQRRKPELICLPMSEPLRRHLEPFAGQPRKLFPFTTCHRDWYKALYDIQREAGIERPYTPQEFRKTCNVEWDAVEFGLGAHVLGHAKRDVNSRHYQSVVSTLCRAVHKLEQPTAFLA